MKVGVLPLTIHKRLWKGSWCFKARNDFKKDATHFYGKLAAPLYVYKSTILLYGIVSYMTFFGEEIETDYIPAIQWDEQKDNWY